MSYINRFKPPIFGGDFKSWSESLIFELVKEFKNVQDSGTGTTTISITRTSGGGGGSSSSGTNAIRFTQSVNAGMNTLSFPVTMSSSNYGISGQVWKSDNTFSIPRFQTTTNSVEGDTRTASQCRVDCDTDGIIDCFVSVSSI